MNREGDVFGFIWFIFLFFSVSSVVSNSITTSLQESGGD
jgi:hypothetical protein